VPDRWRLTAALLGFAVSAQCITVYNSGALTEDLRRSFGIARSTAALVPFLAFVGFTLGAALISPLGARWDRRRMCVLLGMTSAAVSAIPVAVPRFDVVVVCTTLASVLAQAMQIVQPVIVVGTPERERGGVYAWYSTADYGTTALTWGLGAWASETFGWQVACGGGAAVSFVSSFLLLLTPRSDAPPATTSISALLAAPWRELRARRMRFTVGMLVVSGGMFGMFHATYAQLLGRLGQSHLSWVVGVAVGTGLLAAPYWSRLVDRAAERAIVLPCVMAATAFVLLLAVPLVPAAVGAWVIVSHAACAEDGTTGTSVTTPPLLLQDETAQAQASMQAIARYAGAVMGEKVGGQLLDTADPFGAIGIVGTQMGTLCVAFAVAIVLMIRAGLSADIPAEVPARRVPLEPRGVTVGRQQVWASAGRLQDLFTLGRWLAGCGPTVLHPPQLGRDALSWLLAYPDDARRAQEGIATRLFDAPPDLWIRRHGDRGLLLESTGQPPVRVAFADFAIHVEVFTDEGVAGQDAPRRSRRDIGTKH
jgi:predicted MFS family arabinose efflux permease